MQIRPILMSCTEKNQTLAHYVSFGHFVIFTCPTRPGSMEPNTRWMQPREHPPTSATTLSRSTPNTNVPQIPVIRVLCSHSWLIIRFLTRLVSSILPLSSRISRSRTLKRISSRNYFHNWNLSHHTLLIITESPTAALPDWHSPIFIRHTMHRLQSTSWTIMPWVGGNCMLNWRNSCLQRRNCKKNEENDNVNINSLSRSWSMTSVQSSW